MRLIVDSVIRPLAAVVLAAVLGTCNEGCGGTFISPADAYAMGVSGCVTKRNTHVMQCANGAITEQLYYQCKEDADEEYRICRGNLDKQFGLYLSNGEYPSGN